MQNGQARIEVNKRNIFPFYDRKEARKIAQGMARQNCSNKKPVELIEYRPDGSMRSIDTYPVLPLPFYFFTYHISRVY